MPGDAVDDAASASCAGWWGKLPAAGDFISGRLPPQFVDRWDPWLAAGLAATQEHAEWLEAYLASPTWRFLLLPGALAPDDGQAWAGVLMPSVDSAGRYYPLTLACPLAQQALAPSEAIGWWHWTAALQELALNALHDDWPVARLESELVDLGLPGRTSASTDPVQERFAWWLPLRGKAFWCAAALTGAPRWLASDGLQDSQLVAALFGGEAA